MSTRITRSGVAALFTFLVLSLQVHAWERDILRKDFGYSDSSPSSVPMDAIQQGCDRRDCIASIDTPKFLDARAARYLADDDLVPEAREPPKGCWPTTAPVGLSLM